MGRQVAFEGVGLVMCDAASPSMSAFEGNPPCEKFCGRCPVQVTRSAESLEGLTQEMVREDAVAHPSHYGGGDNVYEHIKVAQAWQLSYELGCATKYICRAGKKDPAKTIEDLEKAAFYLKAEIDRRKREAAQ